MTGILHYRRLLLSFLILTAALGFYKMIDVRDLSGSQSPSSLKDFSEVTESNSLDFWIIPGLVKAGDQDEQIDHQQHHTMQTTPEDSPKHNEIISKHGTHTEPNIDNALVKLKAQKPTPKPTEPDFFGEVYASDNQTSQTSCPKSIHKMLASTPFASLQFLASVPVLQCSKHFSPEEYKRLKHFHGAHGWGSVNIDVLKNSLAILNTSANRLMFDDWEEKGRGSRPPCISCAVVGNGGILNGSKKGEEIDKHDYVFRVNGAVIEGFEEDIGTRTTHYTFSTNTLRNSMYSYRHAGYYGPPLSNETRYVFLPDHDRDYILMRAAATHTPIEKGPEHSKSPPSYFGQNVTVEKFKMYHPDFIRYIRNNFLRSHTLRTRYKDIYRPSTGAVMLLAAIHTCDEVSAYGFMTPDYSKYSNHYYDKTFSPVQFYANHDLRLELNLWQMLHQYGLINLYMR